MFHAKNLVTFNARIQTRNSLTLVGLIHICVVRLVIVWIFVCHPDRNACKHSYFLPSTGAHRQKFVKLTHGFTHATISSLKQNEA